MRPIGRNGERYQKIIRDWAMLAQAADQLGYWGFSTIEHHFHSEGYEVGPNPGVLNAWWANMTRNIHLGALGYVMSTQNPVRVAEESAQSSIIFSRAGSLPALLAAIRRVGRTLSVNTIIQRLRCLMDQQTTS